MAEIYGNTTATPIDPKAFSGGDSELCCYLPYTEYKKGQWVIANIVEYTQDDEDTFSSHTYVSVLQCKVTHTSGEVAFLVKDSEDYNLNWEYGEDLAVQESIKALSDMNGNLFHVHYATKKELENVVGGGNVEKNYEILQKIIIGYSILTSKPADWETNFTSYYKNTGTLIEPTYQQLTEYEAWEQGEYYSFTDGLSKQMYISKYPDGNNYELSSLVVHIQFLTDSQGSGTPNFSVYLDDGSQEIACGYFSFTNDPAKIPNSYYVGYAELKNGRLFGGTIDKASGANNTQSIKSTPNSSGTVQGKSIKTVRIGAGIPANSTITISGVKK